MISFKPTLAVHFYQELNGNEPVRKWLKSLDDEQRFIIGTDIKKVQYRWPLGLPLVKNIGEGLWEVRSSLPNTIARVIFIISKQKMILLHGFIKKTQKTPLQDFNISKMRAKNYEEDKE